MPATQAPSPADVARSTFRLTLMARDRDLGLLLTTEQVEQVLALLEKLKPADPAMFKGPPRYPDIALLAEGDESVNQLTVPRHDAVWVGSRVYDGSKTDLWPLLVSWLPPPTDPPEHPAYLFHASEMAIATTLGGEGYPPRLDLVVRPEQAPHHPGWIAAIVRTFLESIPLREAPESAVGMITFTVAGRQEVVELGEGWYRYRGRVYAHPDLPHRIYRIVK
jgi:hypothetical protein